MDYGEKSEKAKLVYVLMTGAAEEFTSPTMPLLFIVVVFPLNLSKKLIAF